MLYNGCHSDRTFGAKAGALNRLLGLPVAPPLAVLLPPTRNIVSLHAQRFQLSPYVIVQWTGNAFIRCCRREPPKHSLCFSRKWRIDCPSSTFPHHYFAHLTSIRFTFRIKRKFPRGSSIVSLAAGGANRRRRVDPRARCSPFLAAVARPLGVESRSCRRKKRGAKPTGGST